MHKSYLSHWEEGNVGTMCRWTIKRPSYAICVENHIYLSYLWLNITCAHASYTWPTNLHICSFHKFSGNSSLSPSLPICTFAVFTSLVGTPSLPYNPYTSILLNTRWFYTMTIALNVVGGKDTTSNSWYCCKLLRWKWPRNEAKMFTTPPLNKLKLYTHVCMCSIGLLLSYL